MTDTDPTAIERTVVFIDLAGFTVATAAHGDDGRLVAAARHVQATVAASATAPIAARSMRAVNTSTAGPVISTVPP